MVKPDGVQRAVVGNTISRFEDKGYQPQAAGAEDDSRDLREKGFFPASLSS